MTENSKKKHNAPKEKESEVDKEVNTSDINIKEKTIEEKFQETEDKLLRSLAEIENQRRRFEKEVRDAFEFGSFNFAKESLAILDNLQRAKLAIKNDESLKDNKDLNKFIENLTIIEKDLLSIFEKNNIKKIETVNKKFDPNFHQAMSEIHDEKVETGTILQEIQAGYLLGERLLRPSLVGISKKSEENPEKKEKKSL